MLNIARGNEIASSVSGIALVGEMLRSCPSFSKLDCFLWISQRCCLQRTG